jgi:hypothetical protein
MVRVARFSVETWVELVTATGTVVKAFTVPVSRASAELRVPTDRRLAETNFSTRASVTRLSIPVSMVRLPKIGMATERISGGRFGSPPRTR